MALINRLRLSIRTAVLCCLFLTVAGCSDQPATTWEDIKHIKARASVDGIGFDVPLNYFYGEYARNQYNWPGVPNELREGRSAREAVDFVKIYALLPELEPVTEQNLAVFMQLGWGQSVIAWITHPRSFDYYFKYSAPTTLKRLPDLPDVPGMLHYLDKDNQDDIFLSHDHSVPELIRIRCQFSRPEQSPSCEVETQYLHEKTITKNSKKASVSTPFSLRYSFARAYLTQWREIDAKLKALYNQFALAAVYEDSKISN